MLDIRNEIKNSSPKAGFELSEDQKAHLRTAGEVALAVAMTAGVVALSAIAPNAFVALDKIFGKKQYGSRKNTVVKRQNQLTKSFYYMRRQGYINIEKRGGLLMVYPTKKGQERLREINFKNLSVKKPKHWNGNWWMVVADIPKQFRIAANTFQKKLKQMEFYPLQRTVWIHPFDPREEIESVATHYHINPFVTLMEIKQLDHSDYELLEDFFRKKGLI
ncbi:MAG: hypothetical protein A3C85_03465 [Candidatus Doudnabacteria bacterium RIFCSPHIGHO2_02_FULL_48_21]|uniref:Transcriptional repressor PaaX-like central Cas2-like domain-containing protein n=1 Tax=Candidatus Doudnabacteria bacterium RIFCSPLOWO2_02_FULL_48_13 TaxID=1817845 RepID=A0A1F5QB74_9BACT|nr:MAG: hypothetical protein A3K05_03655 [Candidatus Doudnabacteria bacterium RIFCSPHIGHO2_01_48_18]OGE77333.1 MAG: hypothetical protein A2668_01245 [Candidatus Doudnabacteria bacterium RIFCSPHIGHO2_01_FULL_48_180]OGE91300.1 MAG: hypothetical protein A3F44_03250 [Candidatus Doudnabacteria bacterium RIFCSPHIGHO2_12_FULL_47_25]OGE93298.1 MAG: hypothetical protein A3C85_03465 [Candidatus Doudnabacteria bacterium RIFCSPHIGHO2_02_FULL_48_21]OGE97796.1 MAG: hypothetical protein A3A83_04345 [Candidatu